MKRGDVVELHYIVPVANVPSILKSGILSKQRAKKIEHVSVAKPEIQERRGRVTVPGGKPLHAYANLYFCGRNPMTYLRREEHATLCILRVSANILETGGVVVTDQNAASEYVRFGASPDGLRFVDRDLVFAEFWTHPGDQIAEWRHKSIKCAEVLVPDRVPPEYIVGAYVSCNPTLAQLQRLASHLPLTVKPSLFFQ